MCLILKTAFGLLLLNTIPRNALCFSKVILDCVQCTPNASYITNMSTWVTNGAINYDSVLIQALTQGYKSNVDVQTQLARSSKYQSIFTYDFDVCNVMHGVQQLKIMQRWHRILLKYGNFMENCPILEGHYYIRNLTVETSFVPPYLQAGVYRIKVRTYFGKFKGKSEKLVAECFVGLQIKR